MKRSLKMVLMSLVLIPCLLLLTACKKSIEPGDYQQRLKDSAEAFYQALNNDLGLNVNMNYETTYQNNVTYTDADGEHDSLVTIKNVTEGTVNIAVDRGSETSNAKIDGVMTSTETGTRVNQAGDGLETYTEVSEQKMTYTYVNDGTTMKVYVVMEVKEDGVLDEEASGKSVYTYTTAEEYETAIDSLVEMVKELTLDTFYTESLTLMSLMGDVEYYQDGKDTFGVEVGYSYTGVSSNSDTCDYTENSLKAEFKDNLPSTGSVTEATTSKTFGEQTTESTNSTTGNYSLTYSASVSAPTGFDSAIVLDEEPSLEGFDF